MEIKDFNKNYLNKSLVKINKIGYDNIIDTIINQYRKNPFNINIDIISNIPNIDIRTNDDLWEDLIKSHLCMFISLFQFIINRYYQKFYFFILY